MAASDGTVRVDAHHDERLSARLRDLLGSGGTSAAEAHPSPIRFAREASDTATAAPPIANCRDDELGDLAEAFDTLLTAVRDSAAANERDVTDLAHEMTNPVAAVRAAAESLARGQAIDEARAERLGRVLTQSNQRLDELATALAGSERSPGVHFAVERDGATIARVAPGPVEAALSDLLQNAASSASDMDPAPVER